MKKIIILISFFVGVFALRTWFQCVNFADPIHFSSFDMSLKLIEAVHNDVGFAPNVVRIYHNKLSLGIILIFNSYLHFWDIRFMPLLISPVLYFGLWSGFWNLFKSKIKAKWIIFLVILLLPFVEIFKLDLEYKIRLMIIVIPMFVFSLYGLWKFIEKDKWPKSLLLVLLIIVSIWYIAIFQNDIFFNCFKG